MSGLLRAARLAGVALAIATAAHAAGGPGSAPEPEGLWTGPMQSYTPSTLKGAEVVDVARAAALIEQGAVLIDVGPADRKPPTLPKTAVWAPQHRSIPGSAWFPGAGPGDLSPAQEATLKARVLELAGGRLDRPMVTFCQPDCWGSWNMGKRLLGWGFKNVFWFPQGVQGWQESDRPTAVIKPDSVWAAAAKAEGAPAARQ
ncbi:rhodanese-like domain-containing protein [Hansschlegelia beijingensis]|uniref:PQQ-dependent catabolism-associated CXXCW motif protein n=1 Tax=Hansschlegelia beijingensis TaxID=1133344 RepID=A0A7W6D139_9HYPH|nr:rhodanese-like domain-containing protein [Hansschlegelia beijingensis]MBB3972716.1 PQQ-dependent catabolism-associated CXXCW motif protein [Hansschlegelia beijingensis]